MSIYHLSGPLLVFSITAMQHLARFDFSATTEQINIRTKNIKREGLL